MTLDHPLSGRSGVRPVQDKTGQRPAPRARPMARRPVGDLRWLVVAVARAEVLSCGAADLAVSLSRLTTRKLGWFGERGVWRGWFGPLCPELDTSANSRHITVSSVNIWVSPANKAVALFSKLT